MDNWDKEFQLDEYYLELLEEGNLGLQNPEDKSDGEKENVRYIDELRTLERPYPGIRPFKTIEAPIFFGRDGQASKLVEKLDEYNFLAVIGSSGSGKSSLIRAGLIPHLFAGFHGDGTSQWKVAICRPGDDPISNISAALAGVHKNSREKDEILNEARRIRTELIDNPYGLLDVGNEILDGNGKLLIIIDQFEELFRYQREVNATDSHHFVSLLMNAVEDLQEEVYIAITMRSEYLGDCVHFSGLTEAINKGQYLVPRLNRSEIKAAIQGPAQMAGTKLDSVLVNKLVSKIGDNMDQLPILQHALMRTYEFWKKDTPEYEKARKQLQLHEKGDPEHESLSSLISLPMIMSEHYEQSGGMDRAIGDHADEVIGSLTPKQYQIAKCIFQRITDKSSDDRGIRRPSYLLQLHKVAEYLNDKYVLKNQIVAKDTNGAEKITVSNAEVNEVIEILRHEDNAFLMPPDAVSLENNPVIDISHESIMRNWRTLKNWIDEELRDGGLYSRLDQSRRDKIRDDERGTKHVYLSGAILSDLKNASENYGKNPAWAARYSPVNSVSYKKLLEENNELNYKSSKGKNRYYPSKTDTAIYQINTDYFKECVAAEKAIVLQRKRRRRTLFVFMGGALLLSIAAVIFFFFSNAKLQKDKDDFYQESQDLSDSLSRKKTELILYQQNFEDSVRNERKTLIAATEKARKNQEDARKALNAAREAKKKADIEKEASIDAKNKAERDRKIAEQDVAKAKSEKEKAEKELAQLMTESENLQSDLNGLQSIFDRYFVYRSEIGESYWYDEELSSELKGQTDSLLFDYYQLPLSIIKPMIDQDTLDILPIPGDRLISLQLSAMASQPSRRFDSELERMTLAILARRIDDNNVTNAVVEKNRASLNSLSGYYKMQTKNLIGFDSAEQPVMVENGKIISCRHGVQDVIGVIDYNYDEVLDIDLYKNQIIIGRKEEEDNDSLSTNDETLPNYFVEILESDTNGIYTIARSLNLPPYQFVAKSDDSQRMLFNNGDSLVLYENGAIVGTFPTGEFNTELNEIRFTPSLDYFAVRSSDWRGEKSEILIWDRSHPDEPIKIAVDGLILDYELTLDGSGIFFTKRDNTQDKPQLYYTDQNKSKYAPLLTETSLSKFPEMNVMYPRLSVSHDRKYSILYGFGRGVDRHDGNTFLAVIDNDTKKLVNYSDAFEADLFEVQMSMNNSTLLGESRRGDLYVWNLNGLGNNLPFENLYGKEHQNTFLGDFAYSQYERFEDYEELLLKLKELGHNSSELQMAFARNYLNELEFDKGIKALERAEELTIFSENYYSGSAIVGGYKYAGAYDKALELSKRIRFYNEEKWASHALMAASYVDIIETTSDDVIKKQYQTQLKGTLDKMNEIDPNSFSNNPLAIINARIVANDKPWVMEKLAEFEGETDDIFKIISTKVGLYFGIDSLIQLIDPNVSSDVEFYDSNSLALAPALARNSGKLGPIDTSVVLAELEQAIYSGFRDYVFLEKLNAFDNLREMEDYQRLMESLRLLATFERYYDPFY